MSRLCPGEENSRGSTEVSVKITCNEEENIMFGKGAYVAMMKRRLNSKEENKREEKKRKRGAEG